METYTYYQEEAVENSGPRNEQRGRGKPDTDKADWGKQVQSKAASNILDVLEQMDNRIVFGKYQIYKTY